MIDLERLFRKRFEKVKNFDGADQCDQNGRFLKYFGKIFASKSSLKDW